LALPNQVLLSDYEDLAAEYYDAVRHPTCANFREASRILLEVWLQESASSLCFCDLGSGRSLLAEILAPRLKRLDRLVLVDESPTMLAYSAQCATNGAHLLLADVSRGIPLGAQTVDVAVASLGDPYNLDTFWSEVQRIVRPGGRVLYTTPSHEWAARFRLSESCELNAAQFALASGETVCVPSFIYPRDQQAELMGRHGLVVEAIIDVSTAQLIDSQVSPKLLVLANPRGSVVTGYLVTRRR